MKSNPSVSNYAYSVSQYICAALHTGLINPMGVIDRLEDRHRAKLPELGLNTVRVLSEAKYARQRNFVTSLALLVPTFWIIALVFDYRLVEEGEYSLEEYFLFFLKPLVLAAIILFAKEILTTHYLRKKIVGSEGLRRQVVGSDEDTGDRNKQNVVIFGGFSPFAGYGSDHDGWSFTIDASKAADKRAEKPDQFTQIELLDFIAAKLKLNVEHGEMEDRIFISGRQIRGNNLFLANVTATPNTYIEQEFVESKIGTPDQDTRHYRVLSIPISSGHLFLTFFLRSTMLGNSLFIESRRFLLPPIKNEYMDLNELPVKRGVKYYLSVLSQKLVLAPFQWLYGPYYLLLEIGRFKSAVARALFGHPEDKLKAKHEGYNYGHYASLREEWASNTYQSYFQMLDKDMVSKTCEHVIINSIVDFLDEKGVATDDIKERRTQIFNSGVMVSGGVVNAQQLAVGANAKVKAKISKTFAPQSS